ncbi:Cupin domain-containing protein [Paenibacillus sp. 1_12]|uniref:cupin domain-containing protein n=1 Tax=Paenibacillus sp. 1_12 TaxID=1566278 RepID=UPI0008DFC8B1|nr:cupin domain-containing protein [Paenibacillus sp. 1_12]SFM49873.1 Cupin domain-containing protein [Paenibacillus sp. 1_12]
MVFIRNFLEAQLVTEQCHRGVGTINHTSLYTKEDFDTKIQFINYVEIPPNSSIGFHRHREDEEVYIIVEGSGTMKVNDEQTRVKQGDILLNKPHWGHELFNDSNGILKAIVFEVLK